MYPSVRLIFPESIPLKEKIATLAKTEDTKLRIVADLIHPSDFVVLVVPIDKAAPKGRLILPQQQTIRDILEADATAIVVKEYELRDTLAHLGKKPRLVITDSQVFCKSICRHSGRYYVNFVFYPLCKI